MPAKLPALRELPGEDRTFGGNKLYVDLVPATSWAQNVRTMVSARHWDRLKDLSRNRTDRTCELCSRTPARLDTHERWSYRNNHGLYVQKLERILCLCSLCHLSTHFGYAQIRGKGAIAARHLRELNAWTNDELAEHVRSAFALWHERNQHTWTLDLSILAAADIPFKDEYTVKRP